MSGRCRRAPAEHSSPLRHGDANVGVDGFAVLISSRPDAVTACGLAKPARLAAPVLLARKRTNRHFIVAIVAAALLTTVFGLWVTFRFGGITLTERIDDIGEAFVAFAAAIACLAAARRRVGRSRQAWLLMAGSAFVWSAGEGVWSYYEVGLGQQVPFPSLADAGFLGAVPLAVAGVLLFTAGTPRFITRLAVILDGLIIAGSLLAVSWTTILETISSAGSGGPVAQAISLAYPISDVVILTMLLLLLAGRVPGPDRLSLLLLAGGLLANLLADSGFAYLTTVNSYGPAQPIDTGWVAGYFLIAVAAFRAWQIPVGLPRQSERLHGGWRLLLLYVPLAAAVIASIADRLVTGSVDDFLFFDLVIVAVFVVTRQFIMLADNAALNHKLQEQTTALLKREEHLRSLVAHSSDVATLADSYGVIRFQSTSVQRIFAYAPGELVGTRLVDLAFVSDRPAVLNCLSDALKASAHPASLTCRLRHKLGTWTHSELTITNLLYLPSVEGLVINIRDVSDRKELEDKVTHQAGHDPLTNLANRSAFRIALEQAVRATEPTRRVSVLMVDVNDFKGVNSALGSEVGDQLLAAVGGRLEQLVPPDAVLARLRSDEFAILLLDSAFGAADDLAEGIVAQFAAPFRAGPMDVSLRVSVGGAGLVSGEGTATDLMRNSDLALRAAKEKGKARYQRYEPGMRTQRITSDAA
jgi:diguanylate cyclase (GGDEF)-like protein/PAS domain S-box-containing protein